MLAPTEWGERIFSFLFFHLLFLNFICSFFRSNCIFLGMQHKFSLLWMNMLQPNFFICKLNWKFIWSFWRNDKEFYKFYSIFEKSEIIFIGKVSRSIDFSSLFYVFALSFFETLHSIKNLAVFSVNLLILCFSLLFVFFEILCFIVMIFLWSYLWVFKIIQYYISFLMMILWIEYSSGEVFFFWAWKMTFSGRSQPRIRLSF